MGRWSWAELLLRCQAASQSTPLRYERIEPPTVYVLHPLVDKERIEPPTVYVLHPQADKERDRARGGVDQRSDGGLIPGRVSALIGGSPARRRSRPTGFRRRQNGNDCGFGRHVPRIMGPLVEVEGRVFIAHQRDIGDHSVYPTVDAENKVKQRRWVLPGDQHEEACDDDQDPSREIPPPFWEPEVQSARVVHQ